MKIRISIFLLLGSLLTKAQPTYDFENVTLLSTWSEPTMETEPFFGARYNSCYGYYQASKQREYAFIGSSRGSHIIDITNPNNPIEADFVPGRRDSCVWREYKTYQNYLYAVSDDNGLNSFQIMDLQYLPDSVHVVYDGESPFYRSHTIFIDGNKLYGGSVTTLTTQYSMAVYSLANPEQPVFLASLNEDYPNISSVHDMYVRNDTVFASCGYDKFYIYKFDTTNNSFSAIGNFLSYPQAGYNHSSFLNPSGTHFVFADEVPDGLSLKLVECSSFSNLNLTSLFHSHPDATPHNPYMLNDHQLIVAYYMDGLQVFDYSDPANPFRIGYFDTYYQNAPGDFSGLAYRGAWGAYHELPSGNIVVSDMQNGLFVLDISDALSSLKPQGGLRSDLRLAPNPGTGPLRIYSEVAWQGNLSIHGISGQLLLNQSLSSSGGASEIEGTSDLPAGVYTVCIQEKNAGPLTRLWYKQ